MYRSMAKTDIKNIYQHYSILCLVATILNRIHKIKIEKVLSWLILIKKCYEETKYQVISVYEPLFVLLFDENDLIAHRNNVILVNKNNFKSYHYKWVSVRLSLKNLAFKKFFLFFPSTRIPSNFLAVSDCLMYNLKSSLAVPHCLALRGLKCNLTICEKFSPPEATKVVLSFFNGVNLVLPVGELTRVIANFLKSPRYMQEGDIYSICLQHYSEVNQEGILYFKVNNIEGPDSNSYFKTYTVTDSTSIFDQTAANYYLPAREWEVIDRRNLLSVSRILALGLEKPFCKILNWFQPFLLHKVNDLIPVFVVSGPSGVGKTLALEAVCSRLGIYFMKVDCSNILSNTTTQIKSNVKNIFKNAQDHSPVLLQLSHAELLSTHAGGNDPDQVIEILSESISLINNTEPLIVVFTCHTLEALSMEILNLSLQTLHMENPTEHERKLMICWLAHRLHIRITESAINFAASETHSYSLADLARMLTLSNKILFRSQKCSSLEREHIKEYLDSIKEKGRVGEVEWEDIGGVERIKKEVLGSLLSSKLMKGLERRGLLLHGPPGTGKTLLARAVANQCNRTFIPVKGPELLNMYVGQSEANIRQVFARAREASPSILFFDELDSLAPNRGNKSDSGGVMDRVVSQLLAEMDGLDSNGDVFILAATNRPDLIDPALLRPGRFDKLLYVGPCEDSESKEKVLRAITRKFKFQDDTFINDLIPKLPKQVTGANLYALCSAAWMEAAREIISDPDIPKNSAVIVGERHFESALNSVKM